MESKWKNYHIILLNTTNKMQRYTIFFIIVNVLHVSGGFSAHHQLKNCTHSIWYGQACCCYRYRGWAGTAVLKLGRFGQQIRNPWKVLKRGAGEGWKSVGPIM
jgi:hypothetical protein